jgi:uncharacterized membrane protein
VQREQEPFADYESQPLSRQEYITAIVHLYRGELSRATAWRIRLDTTTNWAVLSTAGMLAFSFGQPSDHGHLALLLGMLLITLFMGDEARRYQTYDVWRARLRKIEENFYGPILRRNPVSPQRQWGEHVARDLLVPTFKMSFLEAFRARFLRNYWAIYLVLLLAWLLNIVEMAAQAEHKPTVIEHLKQTAFLPWWAPFAYLAVIATLISLLVFAVPRLPDEHEDPFWSGDPGRPSLDV